MVRQKLIKNTPPFSFAHTQLSSLTQPSLAGSLFGDKTWSVVFDNSKIKRFVPEFEAIIPFREGIRRTVEWFEADEARRNVDQSLNDVMNRILAAYAGRDG